MSANSDSEAVETGTLARLRALCDNALNAYVSVEPWQLRALLDIAEAAQAVVHDVREEGIGRLSVARTIALQSALSALEEGKG